MSDTTAKLIAIRTPKGPLWHLVDVASTEPNTLCGRHHGLNPRYVEEDHDASFDLRLQPASAATCKKCIAAAGGAR